MIYFFIVVNQNGDDSVKITIVSQDYNEIKIKYKLAINIIGQTKEIDSGYFNANVRVGRSNYDPTGKSLAMIKEWDDITTEMSG